MLSMLTVLLYGTYLVVFSVFIAISIFIVGAAIKEVRKIEEVAEIKLDKKELVKELNKQAQNADRWYD